MNRLSTFEGMFDKLSSRTTDHLEDMIVVLLQRMSFYE